MRKRPRGPRPLDAASLLVYRRRGNRLEVLMGRRRRRARFSPGAYVFPGGLVEPGDRLAVPASDLGSECAAALRSPAEARVLAMAAVRELAEETGLLLGAPGDVVEDHGGWQRFRRQGLAPPLDRLTYLGRAITPVESPHRYHARFFMAEGEDLKRAAEADGELADIGWLDVATLAHRGLMDVTEAMLVEMQTRLAGEARAPLFLHYRVGRSLFHREPV